jgi:hypothetical protein
MGKHCGKSSPAHCFAGSRGGLNGMPGLTYRFLAACIREDDVEIRRCVSSAGWDWTATIRIACDEGLLPSLNSHLAAFGAQEDEILQLLGEVETSNRKRNKVVVDEIRYAVSVLNEVGIEPVVLKGAAYLAAGIYKDPATRYLGDIDVLIPRSQMDAAVSVLTSADYRLDTTDPFGEYRHHCPPLSRSGGPSIELHRSLGLGICSRLLPAGEVIEKSRPHDYGGVVARIPCPEHLVTHLVMHSQLLHSYTERIWPPLRALGDLYAIQSCYGATLDWATIRERFERWGYGGLLALHLRQAAESLGVKAFVKFELTPSVRVRWMRRSLLRQVPTLRYVDPVYMLSTLLGKRLLILNHLIKTRSGWKHLRGQISTLEVYSRLWIDLIEGRGR